MLTMENGYYPVYISKLIDLFREDNRHLSDDLLSKKIVIYLHHSQNINDPNLKIIYACKALALEFKLEKRNKLLSICTPALHGVIKEALAMINKDKYVSE